MRATSRAAFAAATYPFPRPNSSSDVVKGLSTLVYQQGGTAAEPNQFTDWNALYAAFLQTHGPVQIAIDVTFAPLMIAHVSLGTYDMQGRATLTTSGLNTGGGGELAIPDGGVLKNLVGIGENLQLDTSSTLVSPLQWDGLPLTSFMATKAAFLNTGPASVMRVKAGQTLYLSLLQFVEVNNFPANGPLVNLEDPTSTLALTVFDGVFFVTGNIISGVAGSKVSYLYDATWPGNPANPSFAGVYNPPLVVDIAASMAYTPAKLVDWSGVAPKSVADALDRIAKTVGPILP